MIVAMNGEIVYQPGEEEETRSARTLIGQLENGTLVLAIADRAGEGASISEFVNIVDMYDLDNAALFSTVI